MTGDWSGSPACFLFSITLDVKLGYHARRISSELLRSGEGKEQSTPEPAAFLVERDLLTIGDGDLVLGFSLEEGESELEQCFGIGLEPNSPEVHCLLAGSSQFVINDVEVWSLE